MIREAHDGLGHKGEFTVLGRLRDRFWWPAYNLDVKWFRDSCHICQTHQTRKAMLPPLFIEIPLMFLKWHIDIMVMPHAQGFRYVIHASDSVISWTEGRLLAKESGVTIGKFIHQELMCRHGAIGEIDVCGIFAALLN